MGVPEELAEIGEQLEEHLDAINQNTVEIATANEYVSELDMKLQKLAERVDALQALLLSQSSTPKKTHLTPKEEGVLRVLVQATDPMTSAQLGKIVGLTADLMAQTLYRMKQKEIPLLAQTLQDQTYYALSQSFKQMHMDSLK